MKITYKTNSEVYDLLINMEDRTPSENATLAYVEKFLKYDRNVDIAKLYSDISKVHRLPRDAITKIIDIRPGTPEELIAILNSYSINVDNKVLDSIIDILKGL
jgi:DNA-directed RNA polymerase subunit F